MINFILLSLGVPIVLFYVAYVYRKNKKVSKIFTILGLVALIVSYGICTGNINI